MHVHVSRAIHFDWRHRACILHAIWGSFSARRADSCRRTLQCCCTASLPCEYALPFREPVVIPIDVRQPSRHHRHGILDRSNRQNSSTPVPVVSAGDNDHQTAAKCHIQSSGVSRESSQAPSSIPTPIAISIYHFGIYVFSARWTSANAVVAQ